MSDYIRIYEVSPRDGLQNEKTPIETADKLQLIDAIIDAGLQHIELTSFVHPKAVPQMADAETVMRDILNRYEDRPVQFTSLALNERGYDRAYAAGGRSIAFGMAVSDSFNQRNMRMTTDQAWAVCGRLAQRAREDGVWARVYLMTTWVCPFEGQVAPHKALDYARRLWDLGIDELAIADTIGYAHPLEVGRLTEQVGRYTDMRHLAVHLHDTQALGLANTAAAIQAGVRIVDSSIGGLGGCPFAPGAAGNLATEDLVFMAYKMGFGTGVDFDKLWEIVNLAETLTGRRLGGRIRAWWESTCEVEPAVRMP